MQPGSFDIGTAQEVVGNERLRTIENKARADAEAGTFDPPPMATGSYWSQVVGEMDYVVYGGAFEKRKARLLRMQA